MNKKLIPIVLAIIVAIISMSGCNRTYEAVRVDGDTLPTSIYISEQAKAYLKNDNILVIKDGFEIRDNQIVGTFEMYDYKGNLIGIEDKVLLDSIVAITQYKETTSGGVYLADVMNVIFGVPLSFLAIYCLACPKCCFGSCPTVYTFSDDGELLQSELFSKCISRQLEEDDLDRLEFKVPDNGQIKLKITNEALETHYINKFNLIAIKHTEGTKVFQTDKNSFCQINELTTFQSATSSSGEDVSELLISDDEFSFRSKEEKFLELREKPVKDFIEIDFKNPHHKDKVKMFVKFKNSLLSTVLLYDVVLGSQGINALEWTKKMNDDYVYAMQFKTVYDFFSGITIQLQRNDKWIEVGKLQDAGPINWKYCVAELPVDKNQDIKVRLSFIPDNIMIDFVAIDTTDSNDSLLKEYLTPYSLVNYQSEERNEFINDINSEDELYLVTNPGDSYTLYYNYQVTSDSDLTFFIESRGYYNEWVRGNWIKEKNTIYTFNLFDIQATFDQLVKSWMENKELLEKEFFNSRIFLKEAK